MLQEFNARYGALVAQNDIRRAQLLSRNGHELVQELLAKDAFRGRSLHRLDAFDRVELLAAMLAGLLLELGEERAEKPR